MLKVVRLIADVKWLYPRWATTLAVQTVAALTTLAARRLLPGSWRPSGASPVVAASLSTYVALRMGAHTGVSKRLKHAVMDRIGGDVDDAQTWLLGCAAGGASLVAAKVVQRIFCAGRDQARRALWV